MSTIIEDRTGRYIIVNHSFLTNPNLSTEAKCIYIILSENKDRFPAILQELSKYLCESPKIIYLALKELEKEGYLDLSSLNNKGGK